MQEILEKGESRVMAHTLLNATKLGFLKPSYKDLDLFKMVFKMR